MRYLFLFILIGVSAAVFITIILPRYNAAKALRTEINSYSGDLETADKIKESREALIAKYNDIPKSDLDNLRTLLPDSVDNIRLIIQLDSLATKNGLSTLRNVDYQANKVADANEQSAENVRNANGEFVLGFETSGQYKNFLSFISDLEENLRLVDVTRIDFAQVGPSAGAGTSMSYRVTLKTYWLKQ